MPSKHTPCECPHCQTPNTSALRHWCIIFYGTGVPIAWCISFLLQSTVPQMPTDRMPVPDLLVWFSCWSIPHPLQAILVCQLLPECLPQCWHSFIWPIRIDSTIDLEEVLCSGQGGLWWRPVHNALSQGQGALAGSHQTLHFDDAWSVRGLNTGGHLHRSKWGLLQAGSKVFIG